MRIGRAINHDAYCGLRELRCEKSLKESFNREMREREREGRRPLFIYILVARRMLSCGDRCVRRRYETRNRYKCPKLRRYAPLQEVRARAGV